MAAGAVIGKILQIVGGVADTVGTFKTQIARAQQLRFEAAQARNNAELAQQDKLIIAEASAQERAAIDKDSAQQRAETRTSYAARNVLVDEGSALDVDIAEAERAAAAKAVSRDQQALALQRKEIERQGLLAESKLKRRAARTAKQSARLGAVGGVLQSIGGAVGK